MACKVYNTTPSGFKIPAVGLGTWRAPDAEVEAAIEAALEAGYRHFDCAPVYMNEKVIGRVFNKWISAGKVARDELFVTTKLPAYAVRPELVEKYVNQSLKDLQLDYLDLYLIHFPAGFVEGPEGNRWLKDEEGRNVLDLQTDLIAVWNAMEKAVQKGLIKNIGVSNFNEAQIQKILDNSTIKPVNLQIEIHLYLQQNNLVKFCQQKGITVTAYSPLGSKGIEAFTQRKIPDLMDNEVVKSLSVKYGKTPAQILLKFLLQRNLTVIPKSTNPNRLKQNIELFDFELNDGDMRKLAGQDEGIRICDFTFFKGSDRHPEWPF